MPPSEDIPESSSGFSEKDFYLNEFRGRTLAIAIPESSLRHVGVLAAVIDELVANGSRVVVISDSRHKLLGTLERVLFADEEGFAGKLWRYISKVSRVGVVVPRDQDFAQACRAVALQFGFFKLVCVDPVGGVKTSAGNLLSFVHQDELRSFLAKTKAPSDSKRLALLKEIEIMLELGLESVNVCTFEGLADELFTYAGSGTLFTRDRYVDVRPLTLDDFDAANDLLQRGIDEGYLVPRSSAEVDRVLDHGFGAFVEGRYLAGIGTLLLDEEGFVGEIAALYTVTRFLGEGVGMYLVNYAIDLGRELGLSNVFACTTSETVGEFFERQGFKEVSHDSIVSVKWSDYDPYRIKIIRCYQADLLET